MSHRTVLPTRPFWQWQNGPVDRTVRLGRTVRFGRTVLVHRTVRLAERYGFFVEKRHLGQNTILKGRRSWILKTTRLARKIIEKTLAEKETNKLSTSISLNVAERSEASLQNTSNFALFADVGRSRSQLWTPFTIVNAVHNPAKIVNGSARIFKKKNRKIKIFFEALFLMKTLVKV